MACFIFLEDIRLEMNTTPCTINQLNQLSEKILPAADQPQGILCMKGDFFPRSSPEWYPGNFQLDLISFNLCCIPTPGNDRIQDCR